MQPYNPQQNMYMSTLGNNPHNPNNSNLENILHNNPHKNERGSAGKKLLIGGAIALLVAGGIVYTLNPLNNNEPLPTPTPYTPPAVTTQVPTETTKPTETPSLEDKLPAYAPLSTAQIKEYTLTALQIAYNASEAWDAAKTPDEKTKYKKDFEVAKAWLDRALYALKVSNFEYEKYLALNEAIEEYLYVSLSAEYKAELRKGYKEDAADAAKHPDKEIAIIKSRLNTVLGMAPDSRGNR